VTTPKAWTTFLRQHASAIGATDWPGAPAASEPQLIAAEQRLGIQLPPSYRSFLQTSNGWSQASRSVPVLLPVESIYSFRKKQRAWIDAYQLSEPLEIPETEYFDYAKSDPAEFDRKHLRHTICISAISDDAVLLLNPMVVWPDGEWETWFFANWLPGAQRFRSFTDWFKSAHAEIGAAAFTHDQSPGELPDVYLDPPSKPNRRVREREKTPDFKSVLKSLNSSNPSTRRTAAKRMGRIRSPESFATLRDLLKTEQDHYVRMESVVSIGRIGGDPAIEFLMEWVTNNEEIRSDAVRALARIPDEKATLFVLKLLAQGDESAFGIVYDLSLRNETRAIPHAINLMTNPRFKADRDRPYWGECIAAFGNMEALEALRPFIKHDDETVRQSALSGLVTLAHTAKQTKAKLQARELVENSLATESDPKIRATIQPYLDVLAKRAGD
jgi:hypothetical protein